jgi:putative membrane protein
VSTRAFFAPSARTRVRDAITGVERRTSAEIVVALRRSSGHYRQADLLAGSVLALAALCVFLYSPEPFDYTYLPLELIGFFAFAGMVSEHLPPLQRLLTSRRLRDENVHDAARALFVDRRISRKAARTGILVYLSALELRVEVVADLGVDEAALGPRWTEARTRMEAAFARGALDRFLEALGSLGPLLAEALPHHAGDQNELPDEVTS